MSECAIAPLIVGRSESPQADAPGGEFLVRDGLVTHHTALVRTLASRIAVRVPRQVELEELIAVGMLGLIDAAARYRPSFGVRFDVFARRRINGAMLDALREMDWVPRSLRRMRRDLDGARAVLRQAYGREPEDAEIAASLHVGEAECRRRLEQVRALDLAAVQQSTAASGAEDIEAVADPSEGPQARLERRELHAQLASAVAALPAVERKVLSLYYEGELTLAQIGSVIGLGESRVSQLRAGALGRLRAALKPLLPANRQEAAATPAPWRGRQRRNRNAESMRGARRAQGGRRSAAEVTAAGGRHRLKRRAA